jgi:hypothetical protein
MAQVYATGSICNASTTYSALVNQNVTWPIMSQFSISVQTGYNLINNITNIPVQSSWMLGFSSNGGSIATADPSLQSIYADYQIENGRITTSGIGGLLRQISGNKYLIRAAILPRSLVSLSKIYTQPSLYNISVNLTSNYGTKVLSKRQCNVQDPITNLTINTTTCIGLQTCTIAATYLTGACPDSESANVTWTSTAIGCSPDSFNNYVCIFNDTSVSVANISVTVTDLVSTQTYSQRINIDFSIHAISICTNNCTNNASLSRTDDLVSFLLNVTAVADFNCTFDFGDNTPMTTNITAKTSLVVHNYTSPGNYTLKINCINNAGTKNVSTIHQVLTPATGLQILNTTLNLNGSLRIYFSVSVTNPQCSVIFDNINYACTMYTYGMSIYYGFVEVSLKSVGFYYMTVSVWNLVSNDTLFQQPIYVVEPIQNVTIAAINSTNELGCNSSFVIEVAQGSDVLISLNLGDGNSITNQTNGIWNSSIVINYVYQKPGQYNVMLNVSNKISTLTSSANVAVISRVDSLVVQLASLPAYSQTYGSATATFQFTYAANTYAGSNANVTFWPGDAANNTNGPFALNMDFARGVSQTPLSYMYTQQTGNITAVFHVVNQLGEKYFSLSFAIAGQSDLILLSTTPAA